MISVFYDGLKAWKERVVNRIKELRSELKHVGKNNFAKEKILSDIVIQNDLQAHIENQMDKEKARVERSTGG